MPEPDPADTTAPQVASTLPLANATGVAAGDRILVTFSEPMDPGTIEAAFSSADIPEVSLWWNDELTVLTISPDAGLEYAEGAGDDPSAVPAKTYSITIGAGAADLAGNPLGAPFTLTFATKRRMATAFVLDPALTRVKIDDKLLGGDIYAGDSAEKLPYRSYLTFDLSALPQDVTVESAEFSARQLAPVGAPYTLGAVMAHHLTFAGTVGLDELAPLSQLGAYSQDDGATKSIDVTPQVTEDIQHRVERNSRSQYRLQIDQPTNNDATADRAVFSKATFSMSVIYIAD